MPKHAMENLTESMFYVLLALRRGPMCGTDIVAYTDALTDRRVRIGPATLYTILGKFESEKYIVETKVEGRRRTYTITQNGIAACEAEARRLRLCISDAERSESNG